MTSPTANNDLVLTRVMDVPREKLFRCWTEPELMKQWFAPRPWTTPQVEVDLRPGGNSLVVMRSPEGQDYPNPGVYLEVMKNEKIVFTDAYTKAWEPAAKPFFTAIVTFEDLGGGAISSSWKWGRGAKGLRVPLAPHRVVSRGVLYSFFATSTS